jgi:hypothetical protein
LPKEIKADDEDEESEQPATIPKVIEEKQKPLEEQLDIKKSKDKKDFDSQLKKMKIESLPKPEP